MTASVDEAVETRRTEPPPKRRTSFLIVLVVAAVAYLARLVPVLRGGGLYGGGTYDGSVYYGAASGLAHGLLPYRDFLFLHPPGIVVALLPFAARGTLLGDPNAMALATLVWFGLGALSASMISLILLPLGRVAALGGGLFYAVFQPAVFAERSTLLEPLATALTMTAGWLITRHGKSALLTNRRTVLAGALLGFAACTKIWGVVIVLAVAGWCAVVSRLRAGLLLLAGAVGSAALLCLPFFASDPRAMWRMVVVDQLSRGHSKSGIATRLADIVGLHGHHLTQPLTSIVFIGLAGTAVLACRWPQGRLAVVLGVAGGAVLFSAPSWFPHYAGLTAAPIALLVGSAAATIVRPRSPSAAIPPARVGRPAAAAAVVAGVIVAAAVPLTSARFGQPFPAATLSAAAAPIAGCLTTDDVNNLIETDLLDRNFARGCPLVVDLGGYSYDQLPRDSHARATNQAWQRFALWYLRSGSGTILSRFSAGSGFSAKTAATVRSWTVLARSGRHTLRRPAGPLTRGLIPPAGANLTAGAPELLLAPVRTPRPYRDDDH